MQRERKIGVLRRFVVGLAVAAIVAPAAQARVDELGGGAEGSAAHAVIQGDDKQIVSGNGGSALLVGDDKVIVPWAGDSTVLIHGDDKVFAPQGSSYGLADYRRALPQDYGDPTTVLVGDDKVIVPGPSDSTVLIHGDDKVFAPQGGDSTVLVHGDDKVFAPQGGDSTVLVHGDDKVIAPQPGDYTLAGYRRALPQDYGDPTSIPVGGLSSPGTFDWSDAFVGAGVAFALMLLAGGAALGTRRRDRTAAA